MVSVRKERIKMIKMILPLVIIIPVFFSACGEKPQATPDQEIDKADSVKKSDATLPADPRSLRHFMDAQLHMNQGNYAMRIFRQPV